MSNSGQLKNDKTEVISLLRFLVESMRLRDSKQRTSMFDGWIDNLEHEAIAPLLIDELYHIYRGIGRMMKAGTFSDSELGIVEQVLKVCGNYDDIEKL